MRRVLLGLLVFLLLGTVAWNWNRETSQSEQTSAFAPSGATLDEEEVNVHPPILSGPYRLRVVHDTTGAPMPGAIVSWIPFSEGRRLSRSMVSYQPHYGPPDQEPGAVGPFVADGQGFVFLPAPDMATRMVARHEEMYGILDPIYLSTDQGLGPTIRLKEDPSITLEVVDREGVPRKGVPVALWSGYTEDSLLPLLLARTNAHGRATLHTPRRFLQGQPPFLGLGIQEGLRQPDFLFKTGEPLPAFQQLPLRGGAEMHMQFHYADGRKYEGEVQVQVSYVGQIRSAHYRWSPEDGPHLVLRGYPPEAQLNLAFSIAHQPFQWERITTPTYDASPAQMEFRYAHPLLEIPLSLKTPEDQASQVRRISVHTSPSPTSHRRPQFGAAPTSNPGEFLLTLRERDWAIKSGEEIRFTLHVEGTDPQTWVPLKGTLTLASTLDSLRDSRLEVVLHPPPLLVAGTILDDDGHPASGARVTAYLQPSDGRSRRTTIAQEVRTDPGGRFAIHANPQHGDIHLSAGWRGQVYENLPVVRGNDAHDLVFRRTPYRLAGKVLLAEAEKHLWLTLALVPEESPNQILHLGEINQEGEFHFSMADAPVGELVLLGNWLDDRPESARLASLPRVQPQREGDPQDPRLAPWDLRDAMQDVTVDLKIGAMQVEDYRLEYLQGTNWEPAPITYSPDRVVMRVPGPFPRTARLTGAFRGHEFQLAPGHQVISLESQQGLRLHFPAQLRLPPNATLIAEFRPNWDNQNSYLIADYSDTTTWSPFLGGSGTWFLSVFLVGNDINGDPRSLLLPLGREGSYALQVELQDPEGGLDFHIPLSQRVIDLEVLSSMWNVHD